MSNTKEQIPSAAPPTEQKKRGRKPFHDEEKITHRISVGLRKSEFDLLKKQQRAAGVTDNSAFCRSLVVGALGNQD